MKRSILVGLVGLMLAGLCLSAQAVEVSVGVAKFADDSKMAVTADLGQQFGSFKGQPITADLLVLESGGLAGAVGIKLIEGNIKVNLGYAPGEKAPTISKDTWKNFLGAVQYTLTSTPAPAALGFLPSDPPIRELNVGMISRQRVGAEYTLRF